MDTRTTFNTSEELLSIVVSIYQQKQRVALLIDRNGLTRIQGEIISIDRKEDIGKSVIHIGEYDPVELKDIIGINGLFHADYSEC